MSTKINKYQKTIKDDNVMNLRNNFKYMVKQCFTEYFEDKDMFDIDKNYKSYYYDEIELGTNTFKNVINTLYVEIKQPLNYKNPEADRGIVPDLYLSLQKIKDDIFQLLVQSNDSNTLLWQSKYGIELSYNNTEDELEKLEDNEELDKDKINLYRFRLIIGLSYKSLKNKYGILYYANNKTEVQLEFPIMSIENYVYKNYVTNNLYTTYINVFKNIFMETKKVEDCPSEIFEIMLYNVPNNLFNPKINLSSFKNILNYLRNFSVKEYLTLDEQDYAFTSYYRSMSVHFVRHSLRILEKFYNNLKDN